MGQQVCSVAEALVIARDKGLDLVEISPNAVPPVVKIIDYKKFLYEQKRKQKEIKSKTSKVVLKELNKLRADNFSKANYKFNVSKKTKSKLAAEIINELSIYEKN